MVIRYSIAVILVIFLTLSVVAPEEPDTVKTANAEVRDNDMLILMDMEQKYMPQKKVKKRDYRKLDPVYEKYNKEVDSLLGKDTTNYQ